jgi:integrase
VVGRLARFGSDQGWGEPPLVAEVIEAFVVGGLAGRARSTRGTYRSVLRRLGESAKPAVATPFAGSAAPAPYTGAERAELFSIAGSQRPAWRRASALAMVGLGIGAGLRAGELVDARGQDVAVGPGGVTVAIGGPRGRPVPVAGSYAGLVASLAQHAGPAHLFCPGGAERRYPNFVNNFTRLLVAEPGAPRLCSGRARSSFICDHLEMGTPLAELLYISGIAEVESLLRYARHVDRAPKSKAGLRARLRAR